MTHTEDKALAEMQRLYAGRETSDVMDDMTDWQAKLELYSRTGQPGKKREALLKVLERLALVNDRHGQNVVHRDTLRGKSAFMGKHKPTPARTDIPHYDPTRRK